jgi:hypothetical protein
MSYVPSFWVIAGEHSTIPAVGEILRVGAALSQAGL